MNCRDNGLLCRRRVSGDACFSKCPMKRQPATAVKCTGAAPQQQISLNVPCNVRPGCCQMTREEPTMRNSANFLIAAVALMFLGADKSLPQAAKFATPVKIEAKGGPIDVEIGHAAPFYGDFDGDGLNDLLVGQ